MTSTVERIKKDIGILSDGQRAGLFRWPIDLSSSLREMLPDGTLKDSKND